MFTDKLHVSYKQIRTFTIAFFIYKVSFFHLQKCLLSNFKDNIHNVSDFDSHVGSATGTDHRLVSDMNKTNPLKYTHNNKLCLLKWLTEFLFEINQY